MKKIFVALCITVCFAAGCMKTFEYQKLHELDECNMFLNYMQFRNASREDGQSDSLLGTMYASCLAAIQQKRQQEKYSK